MILPVQITFRNVFESAQAEAERWINEEASRLDKYYGRITSCRVLVEVPHAHRGTGQTYNIRIDIGVPRDELVVKYESTLRAASRETNDKRAPKRVKKEEPLKNLRLAIRGAFKSASRQLQNYAHKMRGEVKSHVPQPRAEMKAVGPEPKGRILRLFSDRGFGFLESPDGREIYFHRNAVVGEDFERLRVGEAVEFSEEPGEEGPHATIVKVQS